MERVLEGNSTDSSTVQNIRAMVPRLFALLCQWRRNAHTRQQLALLGERELADAGIDRCQRERELSKPFWR